MDVKALLISLVFAVSLAGCGGGGGGSDGGTDGGGTVTLDGFSISPSSLTFEATTDDIQPEAAYLTLTAKEAGASIPDYTYDPAVIAEVQLEIVDTTTVKLMVIPQPVSALGEGTHNGYIDIFSDVSDYRVNVTYTISPPPPGDPGVALIAPRAVAAGPAGELVISGSGFSRFDESNPPAVTIGGSAATNVRVISDRELRVAGPTLDAGTHAVAVTGGDVTFPSSAKLEVVSPVAYPAYFDAYDGFKYRVIYDAPRQSIYTVGRPVSTGPRVIIRHRYINGAWERDQIAIDSPDDIYEFDMVADGSALVVAGKSSLYVVDLTQPAPSVSAPYAAPVNEFGDPLVLQWVAATSDGKIMLAGGTQWVYPQAFDPAEGAYTPLGDITGQDGLYQPVMWRSPDGSRVIFSEVGSSSSATLAYYPGSGEMTDWHNPLVELSYQTPRDVALSRDLQTIVFDGQEVRDAAWTHVASLPTPADAVVLSSDGNTAYGYHDADNSVRAYDVSNPGSGVTLVALGTPLGDVGTEPEITISPDDATLFIVGTAGLAVVPVSELIPQ